MSDLSKVKLNSILYDIKDATARTELEGKVDKVTGKGLSTNDYTTAEQTKLSGIATGAQVNQNAFSYITVGSKTVAADSTTDTVTYIAGDNVVLTPDVTNDKITFSAVDTTYEVLDAESGGEDESIVTTGEKYTWNNKVDKVSGKGLSTNDYTTTEKNKLSGIASGAEVNQNAFSSIVVGSTTISADSKTDSITYIAGDNISLTPDATNDKITFAAVDTTYEVLEAEASGEDESIVTTGEKYIWNNKQAAISDLATIRSNAALGATAIQSSAKGAASGVAELDANGKVPSSQLPAYVDDVIEGYYHDGKFYEDSTYTKEITGETGKIYIDKLTEKTYRWSGSAFVEISASLALGTTSSTAYRGDYGNTAYTHSQTTGNPHGTTLSKSTATALTGVKASGTATVLTGVKASGTDSFVKSYPGSTSKLVTTSVPNVTSIGSAPTLGTAIAADDITAWSAGSHTASIQSTVMTSASVSSGVLTFGSGSQSHSFTAPSLSYTARSIPNVTSVGSAPTLGTAITVATGALDSDASGSTVMIGLGTATTASAVTGVAANGTASAVTGVAANGTATVLTSDTTLA